MPKRPTSFIPSLNEYKEKEKYKEKENKLIAVEFAQKAKTPANVEAPAGAAAVTG